MKRMILAFCLLGPLTLAGCGRTEIDGPPTLRLGRDGCGECGMAIHEERSSAAFLLERGGRREYVLFDDIGCMLDAERAEGAALGIVGAFVHDYSSSAWVPAEAAVFLVAEKSELRTPMGSGIAAFADRAGAEESRHRFGGEILDFKALAAWRRDRMDERRGRTGS